MDFRLLGATLWNDFREKGRIRLIVNSREIIKLPLFQRCRYKFMLPFVVPVHKVEDTAILTPWEIQSTVIRGYI